MILILLALISSSVSYSSQNNYFDYCSNDYTNGSSIPFHGRPDDNQFRKECAPDVLYSWQKSSRVSIDQIKDHPIPNKKYIYTWRTPLGSFGYGDILIRLKLKKNVKFKWLRQGVPFACPQPDQENTVYVHSFEFGFFLVTGVEYILCSKGPVESWSVGQRGTQIEAENELRFMQENLYNYPQAFDSYALGFRRARLLPRELFYDSNPYFITWDTNLGTDWKMSTLEKRIESIHRPKNTTYTLLFCNGGQTCTLKKHFETQLPTYFKLETPLLMEASK
jgi:hypothetical protein